MTAGCKGSTFGENYASQKVYTTGRGRSSGADHTFYHYDTAAADRFRGGLLASGQEAARCEPRDGAMLSGTKGLSPCRCQCKKFETLGNPLKDARCDHTVIPCDTVGM